MKSLRDAERIQTRVLAALEEAEQTPDPVRREQLQSVVVIGGGPTGCELAASLIDLLRHTLARDFKQLDPQRCRVTLVDPGDRVLRAMDPSLSRAAGDHLRRSVPGHPEIRVVGDLCRYDHTPDGQPLPGMAGPAVQMGAWVAGDLLARSQGRQAPPFRYVNYGSMAVIGPFFAVADLRGLKVSGPIGWWLWGLAHLAFMPARENRITLLTKWLWMIVARQRSALVIREPAG